MRDARLMQVGALVRRIAAHPLKHRLLRREVQDAPTVQAIAAALNDP